jgi:hypothetical protein
VTDFPVALSRCKNMDVRCGSEIRLLSQLYTSPHAVAAVLEREEKVFRRRWEIKKK